MTKTAPKPKSDPILEFCRALPGATEDVKWEHVLVFCVGGKMFAGFRIPEHEPLAFKVEPLAFDGIVGRSGIIPAPYMARHSWVSVTDRKRVSEAWLKESLRESHRLVALKLPKRTRAALGVE